MAYLRAFTSTSCLQDSYELQLELSSFRIVGYDENKCEQPWTFPLTLKLLVSVPPICFTLIALLFLHYYPITEKSRERTKQLLAERRYGVFHVREREKCTMSYVSHVYAFHLICLSRRSSAAVDGGSPYEQRTKGISISQWDKEKNAARIRAGSNVTSNQQSEV